MASITCYRSRLLGTVVGLTVWFSQPSSLAQAADTSATKARADTQKGTEEIIVTAQKREQRLSKVGLSVTAITGRELTNQRVASVSDLVKLVPGLQATPSPNSTPVYTLRGVGFFESSVAAYPDVSIYLDQAPLPLPAMSALTAFDLARVEVLKGPQGTLFGNNATGGAINFIATKPTKDFHAGIDVGYGRFNSVTTNGFVSGPLTNNLQGRISFATTNSDDWQQSYTRHDTLGAADTQAVRTLLNWQPRDDLRFMLDVNAWKNQTDTQAPQLARRVNPLDLQDPIGTVGPTGTIGPNFPLLSAPPAPANNRAADWSPNNRPFADNSSFNISLNSQYDVAPDVLVTSITNYVNYAMHNATEGDGTALNDLDITRDTAHADTFTQEVRFSNSNNGDRLRWVLGANYERTDVGETLDLLFPQASSGAQQGFSADSYSSEQALRNTAGFGNVEFDIVPDVTLKGGIRYTDADRTTTNKTYPTPGYAEPFPGSPGLTSLLNFVWGAIYTPIFCPGVVYKPIIPGAPISIDPKTCATGAFNGDLHETNTSWSVGLDYRMTKNVLLYVNIAKGYKAGSYPTVSAATFAQYAPAKQESILDYEVGFKAAGAGGRVSLTGAAFYYDYSNKQLRGKELDPIFGLLDTLVNVPKSNVKGLEFDSTAVPVPGLRLRVAGTYLDTDVDKYDGIVGLTREGGLAFPVISSFTGTPLPFSPRFEATSSADYTFDVAWNMQASVGASFVAQSGSIGSLELSPQDKSDAKIPGYGRMDIRAGLSGPDGRWRLAFWCTNVTDKYYWTDQERAFDTIIRYTGRPREYGLTFGYRW